jgi:tRNA1Val (adenine37-N6)-methyltransferase
MASRSIRLNNLENKFEIINSNIKDLNNIFEEGSFDAIVSNPPYKKDNSGLKNEDETKLISRHEITASLEDFITISSKLLKNNGNIYMVHRPERLSDLFYLLKKYNLEPKKLRMVQSYIDSKPKLVLVKATKNAKSFLNIEEPLIIYNQDGSYTDEIFKIYGKEEV